MDYRPPGLEVLGTLEELTGQFDKIGDTPDAVTPFVPTLDGSIVPE